MQSWETREGNVKGQHQTNLDKNQNWSEAQVKTNSHPDSLIRSLGAPFLCFHYLSLENSWEV